MRYAHQNGGEFSVEIDEMKAFLGLNLVMGYHTSPSLRDYWSTEPDMAVPFVANVMPRARSRNYVKIYIFVITKKYETLPVPILTEPTK